MKFFSFAKESMLAVKYQNLIEFFYFTLCMQIQLGKSFRVCTTIVPSRFVSIAATKWFAIFVSIAAVFKTFFCIVVI